MDFVHDQLATGLKIRVLTIVDTFCRFSPAVDPRFSYRGEDVERPDRPAASASTLTAAFDCSSTLKREHFEQ
jgi:hypothetical protein